MELPLRIVSRNEWFAHEPQRNMVPLELPAIRVIIAHTADRKNPTLQVFNIQKPIIPIFLIIHYYLQKD